MPKKEGRSAEAHPHLDCNSNSGKKQLLTVHNMVLGVLTNEPRTRSDDRALAMEVYRRYYKVDIYKEPFAVVMCNDKLPSIETIGRCRRKVQEEREDLRAVKAVEDKRISRQEDFIEYAGGIA